MADKGEANCIFSDALVTAGVAAICLFAVAKAGCRIETGKVDGSTGGREGMEGTWR